MTIARIFEIRNLLIVSCIYVGSFAHAQNFSISGGIGDDWPWEPFENGSVLTFSTLDLETAAFWFSVKNESDATIQVMAEFLVIDNADGTQMEFCMGGTCFSGVSTGAPYLPVDPVVLTPDEIDETCKMWNHHPGLDTEDSVIYEIKISEVDAEQNFIGDPFLFTYIYYNAADEVDDAGIADETLAALVSVYPTATTDFFTVETPENLSYTLYNQVRQVVDSGTVNSGSNQLSVENLNAGFYYLSVETASGSVAVKKIVKQ